MSLDKVIRSLWLLKNRIDSLKDKTIKIKLRTEKIEKRIIKNIENKMRRL